jgi:hypothetical protein
MQRVLCILALLRHSRERSQLAGDAERRLVHESAGGREGRGSVELEGGIATGGQVLADEERDKYQRQDAGQTEAAEITELTQTDLGEWGKMGHMGSRDGSTVRCVHLRNVWEYVIWLRFIRL